jgi:hypothetical protein
MVNQTEQNLSTHGIVCHVPNLTYTGYGQSDRTEVLKGIVGIFISYFGEN